MLRPRFTVPSSNSLKPWLLAVLALPVGLLLARPASAQCDRSGCPGRLDCAVTARPSPYALWWEIVPVDPDPLPSERDTTYFNEFATAPPGANLYWNHNWFYGVDIENGWVIAGLAHGVGIWDARTNAASPTFVAVKRYGAGSFFPVIPTGEGSKIVFGGIDSPDDTVAALAGYNGAGLLVFDLSNKTNPKPVYQNTEKTAEGGSVYATTIGGVRYAFLATTAGLFVYNLNSALGFNGCLQTASNNACPGVLLGQIPTAVQTTHFVHGTGNYVVASFGASRGFQIFDVSNPASPQLKLSGLLNPGGRQVAGVALWKEGSTYYLGARLGRTATLPAQTAIYNVSCITGTCSGLGSPLWTGDLDTKSTFEYLTFSRSGSIPFLYVGGDAMCASTDGEAREWLLDVSNPASPHDVSPTFTLPASGLYNGVTVNKTVSYWSWYYRTSPTGFNLVMPRSGKFAGDYFYRAARSIFDIHKLTTTSPPVVNFTWSPIEVYAGDPVSFSDLTIGAPTSWLWSFPGGTPEASVQQSQGAASSFDSTSNSATAAGEGPAPAPEAAPKPSFLAPGPAKASRAYLIGVLSARGLNQSFWQTDVLLSNISSRQVAADVTFTGVGLNAAPSQPLRISLAPGASERLENLISDHLGIRDGGVGVLTISTSAGDALPIVQGERYESTNLVKSSRQAMTAVSDAGAAAAGEAQHLVGLRQDATNRTTLWLFNPGDAQAEYDVVYRTLDGAELGTVKDVRLGAGRMRQLGPGQHPLPAAGVAGGFTVQVVVRSGKVLSAAQVINDVTSDMAYIQGEVR
jgi:hypothetical protein